MTDLVAAFRAWLPSATPQARADALKVIEQQTQMTASALEQATKSIMTTGPDEVWRHLFDKLNLDIEEFLTVEELLRSPRP
jgi:Ca2+-binding EF-hand superfamily protein